jgi:membrane protein involved in colicin uptake
MSDDQSTETVEQPQEGAEQQTAEAKTFDADYVKKLRDEAAKYRTEAKANADAAKKLAEIEEANSTEAEKQAKRRAEAEERAKALEVKANRADVASETGIPADLLAGPEDTSTDAIKAYAAKVIAFTENAGKARPPKPDANQGRTGVGVTSTADSFAEFFRNNLSER